MAGFDSMDFTTALDDETLRKMMEGSSGVSEGGTSAYPDLSEVVANQGAAAIQQDAATPMPMNTEEAGNMTDSAGAGLDASLVNTAGGSAPQAGMSDTKRFMLQLAQTLGSMGSGMMNKNEAGANFGNVVATNAQNQLYNDALKKAIAGILSNGGSGRPFGNSPVESLAGMDLTGLTPEQGNALYGVAHKERDYPIEVMKALSDIGLKGATAAHTNAVTAKYPEMADADIKAKNAGADYHTATAKLAEAEAKSLEEEKEKYASWVQEMRAGGKMPEWLDEGTFKLMNIMGPKERKALITSAIAASSKDNIKSPKELVVWEYLNKGKVSDEAMKLLAAEHKAAGNASTRGAIMNQTGQLVGARILQLLDPMMSSNQEAMKKLQQELKPDNFGNLNLAPAYAALLTSKHKDAPAAKEKLNQIRDLYRMATDRDLPPDIMERAIDNVMEGKPVRLPAQFGGTQAVPGTQQASSPQEAYKTFAPVVQQHATEYGVDPRLAMAVVKAESNWDVNAIGKRADGTVTGARNLMQIMPSTAEKLAAELKLSKDDILNDPATNIKAGTYYLSKLTKMFNGNTVRAVAAYNAGPAKISGNPDMKGLKQETIDYVGKVFGGQLGRDKNGKPVLKQGEKITNV